MKKSWKRVFDNELIKLELPQKYDDKVFAMASKAGDYLPRLQLMTSNSEACKDGKIPMNHYALVNGQNYTDLSADVDVLVITWRPKALEMGEVILSVFDPEDAEFKRIAEKSEIKDSGCMFGIEFLVWVPVLKQFATFFMGSKSSRRESANVKALLNRGATLKSQKIETPKYSWYSPLAVPCTTPFELPSVESLTEEAQKFLNPPKQEIEKVEQPTTGRAR